MDTGLTLKSEFKQPGLFETVRREMRLRNYSHKTAKAYLSCLRSFVKYFRPKHPRELAEADLRAYLLHLIEQEKYAAATVNQVFWRSHPFGKRIAVSLRRVVQSTVCHRQHPTTAEGEQTASRLESGRSVADI